MRRSGLCARAAFVGVGDDFVELGQKLGGVLGVKFVVNADGGGGSLAFGSDHDGAPFCV